MASKAKATQAKEEAPEKEAEGAPDSPLPLLDLNDAGVKKMIKAAKKRGFVTFDALNAVLPSESTSPEQIEDIMAMLSEMGIYWIARGLVDCRGPRPGHPARRNGRKDLRQRRSPCGVGEANRPTGVSSSFGRSYGVAADRRWREPLVNAIFPCFAIALGFAALLVVLWRAGL